MTDYKIKRNISATSLRHTDISDSEFREFIKRFVITVMQNDIITIFIDFCNEKPGRLAWYLSHGFIEKDEIAVDPEVFYRVGQIIKGKCEKIYTIIGIDGYGMVGLLSPKGFVIHKNRAKVQNPYKITRAELSKVWGSNDFEVFG